LQSDRSAGGRGNMNAASFPGTDTTAGSAPAGPGAPYAACFAPTFDFESLLRAVLGLNLSTALRNLVNAQPVRMRGQALASCREPLPRPKTLFLAAQRREKT
jgi:hypothetical protein